MHKLMLPEVVRRVLDEFYECDEESPRVGPVHNQSLQQNTAREEGEMHVCVGLSNSKHCSVATGVMLNTDSLTGT